MDASSSGAGMCEQDEHHEDSVWSNEEWRGSDRKPL